MRQNARITAAAIAKTANLRYKRTFRAFFLSLFFEGSEHIQFESMRPFADDFLSASVPCPALPLFTSYPIC